MFWIHADRAIIGDGKRVISPAWVLVDGETIRKVTEQAPDNIANETIIELQGVTLTPGLMNMHDHICRKTLREPSDIPFSQRSKAIMLENENYLLLLSVRNMRKALREEGITWVRDYGLGGYTSVHLRRAIKEGLVEGPEISTCGRPICQSGGHTYRLSHQADGVDGVRAAVRQEIREGADVIKFMGSGGLELFPAEEPTHPQYTIDELKAGVEAAHDQGLLTAVHAYSTEGIYRSILAGVDSIEHGCMMTQECIDLMAERQTALVPTMTGIRAVSAVGPLVKLRDELQARVYGPQEEGMRMALKAGILIGTGTDSGGKLSDEIRLTQQVLRETPVEALAHATGIAAQIARRPDLGLLEEGRKANIVAFKGDLTRSLDGLDDVVQVWKAGQAYV